MALSLLLGCTKKESKPEGDAAASKPAPAAESAPDPKPAKKADPMPGMPLGNAAPVGPPFLIAAGQSLGPIRAGTNLETLARHMEGPCDIQTEERCIYVDQAAEFTLLDGIVVGIKVHRRDRLVPGNPSKKELRYYGTFNGGMQPKIMLGLHRHIVLEEFGEPKKKEPLSGKNGEVERHIYEGVIFEYDKIHNGNTVLSAIEVVLPEPPPGLLPSKQEAGGATPPAK